MRAFIALALIAAVAFADASLDISFVSGKNLTNAEGDFKFRYTDTYALTGVPAMGWVSASIDADHADEKTKASADVIVGFGSLPTRLIPPVAFAAYASGKAAVELKLRDIAADLVNSKLDANLKGGAVAISVPLIEEVNKNGDVVDAYAVMYGCTTQKKLDGDVTYITCSGDHRKGPELTVTYVTSKRSGILKYGQTPVSPRSFEMIVEGKNFRLKSEDNHLRAKVALITASGEGKVKGEAQVRKVGGTEVYAAASSYVVIDGERVKVDVSVKSGEYEKPSALDFSGKLLEAAFGGNFDARIASVDFPAGKTNFVYDPALGAGSNIYKAGASTAVMSFFVVLVCALLALF